MGERLTNTISFFSICTIGMLWILINDPDKNKTRLPVASKIVPSTSPHQPSKTDTGSDLPVDFPRNQNGTRVVVLWTGIYFHGASDLDSKRNCSGNINGACVMTTDKSKYKAAEGIIFHLWHESWNGSVPHERYPWQHYIVFTSESAGHHLYSTEKFNKTILPTVSQPGFFNLTSTFRSDSDFPIPYFYTERRGAPCDKCLPNSSFLATKNKFMIWIVSHCYTQSKREDYMKELNKYIPVDIFGKCGNRTKCDSWRKDCTRDMMKDYKFYFAAENAICKEYFTEKLYRALETFVIPVVYGGGDVHRVAPPHSYIDVRDFKSPKHLAEYLIYLDTNDEEYLSYFKWKQHFKIRIGNVGLRNVFCQYCRYLVEDNGPRKVSNFTKWFFEDSKCTSGSLL